MNCFYWLAVMRDNEMLKDLEINRFAINGPLARLYTGIHLLVFVNLPRYKRLLLSAFYKSLKSKKNFIFNFIKYSASHFIRYVRRLA